MEGMCFCHDILQYEPYFQIHFYIACRDVFLHKLFQSTVVINHILTHHGLLCTLELMAPFQTF
jgi:hypothetical protein